MSYDMKRFCPGADDGGGGFIEGCGFALSPTPDYWWDACPEPFTTYDDGGITRVSKWTPRAGSLDLDSVPSASYDDPFVNNGNSTFAVGSGYGVRFTDDYLAADAFPALWTQPFTIAIVLQWAAVAGSVQYTAIDGIDTTNRAVVFKSTGAKCAMFAGSTLESSIGAATNDLRRIICVFDGANSVIHVNGTEDSGNPGSNSLAGIGVGQRITTLGSTAYLAANVGEIALWNRALDASERSAVNSYWESKW